MTREEAIRIAQGLITDFKCESETMVDFCNTVIKALGQQKALEQRWIPVSERLPEQPYGCLVTIEDEEPMTGQWFETILPYFVGWDGDRWNDADGEQCPFEVIAWMPLPEPYKAESEDKYGKI